MAVAKTFPNVLVIVHECVCGCVLVWAESNKSFLYSIIVPILGHTNQTRIHESPPPFYGTDVCGLFSFIEISAGAIERMDEEGGFYIDEALIQ